MQHVENAILILCLKCDQVANAIVWGTVDEFTALIVT